MTIVVGSDDDPQFMRMAFAAHQPRFGHITVHPTPLAGDATHLAHDLIRSLGKHWPLPDGQYNWLAQYGGTTQKWHLAAAWSLALGVNRVTVCRAHLLRLPKWHHLLAFSARTGTRFTLVCNGPIPREVLPLIDTIAHRIVEGSGAAAEHWQTPTGLQELEGHSWWQHQAAIPPPDDEPWSRLPSQPRRRLIQRHRFQHAPAVQQPQVPASRQAPL
ncbi:hypothetical protein ACIBAC_41305 [Streptomyces sp. NPDC051362]|uniref:hypothetical protein n=1 Tax=Streptomyces sp. NPDC051362 TaxID=3365651 RepID=UPI0037967A44